MDEGTAAAVAAVVIAVLAMIVAAAQAVQQYYITGQLIRICDSVVYGTMPGRGRRVWAGSQFRFRVVYEIPQICLRPDLWDDGYASDVPKQLLPDLRQQVANAPVRGNRPKRTAYSARPGEASWASFCRVMQYTAGKDLVYELVEEDADRCPADLSVVPMLVSLRDIVTISLTAGMVCTDASFADKTIAMEGRAGTITSSRHPILGALLRFTPKNFDQPPGLRVCDGSLDVDWMARMWDIVVVAGRHYSQQDRKYYAAYERDSWTTAKDLAIVRFLGNRRISRASSPTRSVRSVRSMRRGASQGADEPEILPKSPQDGDWSFVDSNGPPRRRKARPDPFAALAARDRPRRPPASIWHESFAYKARGRELLDGLALQKYIEEKRRDTSASPVRNHLLSLPSFPGEGAEYDDWERLYAGLSHERTRAYAQRWREVVERRRKRRKKREIEGSATSSRQTSRIRSSSQASRHSLRSLRSVDTPRGRPRERRSSEEAYGESLERRSRERTASNITYGNLPIEHPPSHSEQGDTPQEGSPEHPIRSRSRERRRREPSVAFAAPNMHSPVDEQPDSLQPSPRRSAELPGEPPRGILRRPRAHFPEDPHPIREGVAPLQRRENVPEGARWTKIERRLVSPAALISGGERFEERADHVIVLRVLTREEIEAYATLTSTMNNQLQEDVGDDHQDADPETELEVDDGRVDGRVDDNRADDGKAVRFEASAPRERSRSRERLRSPTNRWAADRGASPSQTSRTSEWLQITDRESSPYSDQDESTGIFTTESDISGDVNWFWICQADVLPGYFATPWPKLFAALACSGAIAVMMTALEWFTDESSLTYTASFPHCETWIRQGRTTHPSYAINAMGGIVVSATYPRVKFEALAMPIPPLQLLETAHRPRAHSLVQRLSELMALDSWLSFCGRLPEIYNGRSDLLRTMPSLVQKVLSDFAYEFGNVDRTAAEGGWQLIKEMADLVLRELDQLLLDEAEQLFALVAILRAAKMALSVVHGSDTAMLQEIFIKDAQVYLV